MSDLDRAHALGDAGALLATELALDWSTYGGTADLFKKMARGEKPDTRAFLRPIYKAGKHLGVGATDDDGDLVDHPVDPILEAQARGARWRKHGSFVSALALAEWLVVLRDKGWNATIPPQAQLQPSYAYNTIITMCQRASAAKEAIACYGRMCFHGLAPDVFTMTALVDIAGRSRDPFLAQWFFERMPHHGLAPNAVTLVTASRVAVVHGHDALLFLALKELTRDPGDVEQDGAGQSADMPPLGSSASLGQRSPLAIPRTPSIVIISVLECCAGAERWDLMREVLVLAQELGVCLDAATAAKIFAPLWSQPPDHHGLVAANGWVRDGLLTPVIPANFREKSLAAAIDATPSEAAGGKDGNPGFWLRQESLGRNSSSAMRSEVVEHDVTAVLGRGEAASRSDFETLIHQCRKRKWSAEVSTVLNAMELAPAHCHPTAATLVCAVEAHLDAGQIGDAWNLVVTKPRDWGLWPALTASGHAADHPSADAQQRRQDRTELGMVTSCLCRGAARHGHGVILRDACIAYFLTSASSEEGDVGTSCASDLSLLRGTCRALGAFDPKEAIRLIVDIGQSRLPQPLSLLGTVVESWAVSCAQQGTSIEGVHGDCDILGVLEMAREVHLWTSPWSVSTHPGLIVSLAMASATHGIIDGMTTGKGPSLNAAMSFNQRLDKCLGIGFEIDEGGPPHFTWASMLVSEAFLVCPRPHRPESPPTRRIKLASKH